MADESNPDLDPLAGIDPYAPENDVEVRDAHGRPQDVGRAPTPAADGDEDGEGVATFTTRTRRVFRRVMGERQIDEAMPTAPAEGESVHFVTHGDVDFTSFLLWLAHRQRLRHLAVSTWAMSMTDVEEVRRLVRNGRVGRLDAYCGQHSMIRTPQAWLALKECCRSTGGRAVLFRNHSKVAAWLGEEWDGALEGSANLATNLSMEQVCITRDAGLARFFLDEFGRMESLESEV